MTPAHSIPSQIAGYHVLSLSLPPLPSFPAKATHYIYVGPHQPKVPHPNAARSLFLVNVPFDATEIHLKRLLSQQIGLPAGRIEDVRFEGQRGSDGHEEDVTVGEQRLEQKGKKRKRGAKGIGSGHIEGAELPATWDRNLLKGNFTAVVLFVDKSSADVALKAVKKAQKENKEPIWGEGVEDKVPPLGSASMLDHLRNMRSILLMPCQDILGTTNSPTLTKALYSILSTST